MIHPNDQKTGIQYRLLPMTRSMLAELLTPEQVSHHLEIIEKELTFPDGVRLMNKPANYRGGVSTNFKRAEQAANLVAKLAYSMFMRTFAIQKRWRKLVSETKPGKH